MLHASILSCRARNILFGAACGTSLAVAVGVKITFRLKLQGLAFRDGQRRTYG